MFSIAALVIAIATWFGVMFSMAFLTYIGWTTDDHDVAFGGLLIFLVMLVCTLLGLGAWFDA